jgi:hypothetical protein
VAIDGERILRPNKWRLVPHLLLSLAFLAIGIRMIRDGAAGGWFVAIGFGMTAAALVFLLRSQGSYLQLAPDRFTVRSLVSLRSYRWQDIERFAVMPFGLSKLVGFTVAPGHRETIPDTYGMPPQELADLMNEWRDRHSFRESR